jgi:hypothetical protein
MGPYNHGMARPQDAVGGTASHMEGSCEKILNKQSRKPTRDGPPAWGLGEMLTTPQRKNVSN